MSDEPKAAVRHNTPPCAENPRKEEEARQTTKGSEVEVRSNKIVIVECYDRRNYKCRLVKRERNRDGRDA